MTRALILILALAMPSLTLAGEQVRIYGPDGRSVGTIAPDSQGSSRFYDRGGNSRGTSTTTGTTTRDYDSRGNLTGTTTGGTDRRR